jgi:IMP dehydrogenase
MKLGLAFDDVLIVPRFSDIRSRSHPDTTVHLTSRYTLGVPIIASNMDTVCEAPMAIAMRKIGALGVIHRFMSIQEQADQIRSVVADYAINPDGNDIFAAAIGTKDEDRDRARELCYNGANLIVIDIAHGHSRSVIEMIRWLKDNESHVQVVAGNVATADGVLRLQDAGADAIKVGIGPGAACETRQVAGVGVPQLTALLECAEVASVPIWSDGGIKIPGDLAKAIAAGANAAMMGSALAGADEAPLPGQYGGMASAEAQLRRNPDLDPKRIVAEGKSGVVESTGPVADTVYQFVGGLRSAMSYVGVDSIEDFQRRAEFIQQTEAGRYESHTRI